MTKLRATLLLALALIWAGLALAADYEAKREEIAGLGRELNSIERAIPEAAQDDAKLVALRVRLDTLAKSLIGFGVSLRPRLTEINSRLAELGSPPKEGEPEEPQIITDERRALTEEKAINNGLLAEAEQLSIRAAKAGDQIAALRRELFSNTLFRRTEISGVFGAQVLSDLAHEFDTVVRQVSARLVFMASFRRDSFIAAIGLSLLLGVTTYWGVRRLFGSVRTDEPEEEEDSYISRLSLAFWSTVIPSLTVAAALAVTYGLFLYFGVFNGQTLALFEAFLVACAAIFFVQRLANALFAPGRPDRRLILVSDRAARMLVMLTVAMAVMQVIDYFLGRVSAIYASPLSLTVAKSFVSSLIISGLLIAAALVKPFTDSVTGLRKSWPGYVRYPIIATAVAIILAALVGYIGLARFMAAQIVVTGAILATMYIGVQSGHVLAAEGAFPRSRFGRQARRWFSLDDTALDQLGLLASFLIYAVVFLIGLPLILLQWGFNWVDIRAWLTTLLTDITIGSITISLLGILFGVVIFVIGFLSTRRFQNWLDGRVMARSRVDAGVRNSIRTIVGYAGIILAAIIGLSAAGFNLSNLALVAGALSVGIGFGLQSIVNNFVSGLILLAERPFKVGDWIVAGGIQGTVRKISVRVTEIETGQRQTVILPNSELINSAVGNWTHRNASGRVDVKLSVAHWEDPRRVRELLLEIARHHPGVLKAPAPNVAFVGIGQNMLDFEVQVFVSDITRGGGVATEIRLDAVDAFRKEGISLPFTVPEPPPATAAKG
ncbi:MAG: mechanosensitive ion channel family protein [Rhizobiales bacterium]|nr:mechanosensitive ion channel family protein [Hyphomicrobiales bacterium]